MKVKGVEKAGLKLNIQKTKIITSGPITSWQIDGEMWKQWQTLFGGLQITPDDDWNHEIKRHLLIGKKVMNNLDSLLKGRDITLPKKGPSSQSYGFPIVM